MCFSTRTFLGLGKVFFEPFARPIVKVVNPKATPFLYLSHSADGKALLWVQPSAVFLV